MSKVVPLAPSRQAEEQATIWISRLDRGLTDQEKLDLSEWVQSSESNRQALLGLSQVWDEMDRLHQLGELFPIAGQVAASNPVGFFQARKPLFGGLAFAAMLFLMLIVFEPFDKFSDANSMSRFSYQTAIGEQSVVSLPDASQITLNTNSEVEVFYSQYKRQINLLQGEAHFDVTHDADRPFIVNAGNKSVRAVGTAFNVAVYDKNSIEVVVDDGRVVVDQFSTPIQTAEAPIKLLTEEEQYSVSKGEKVVFTDNKVEAEVQTISDIELSDRLSWKSGKLVFRGEPLSEALLEIERYTQVRIEMASDALKPILIVGIFQTGDVDGLLVSLEQNFNIGHTWMESNHIVLEQLEKN